jgi:predicted PurR-regulated permease PerM
LAFGNFLSVGKPVGVKPLFHQFVPYREKLYIANRLSMGQQKPSSLQLVISVLLLLSLSAVVLYFAKPFLVPLALAGMLAMLLLKICIRFERYNIKRSLAALFSVLILATAISVIILLIGWQLSGFTENMNELKEQVFAVLEKGRNWLDDYLGIDHEQQKEIVASAESSSSGPGNMLLGFASIVLGISVDSILVMVYVFLFLLFRTRIKNFILMLVNVEHREKATHIVHKSSAVAQQYLEGLSKMIENALFFAVLCGLLEIVPFVGNLLGTTFTVIAVAAQGGDSELILGVIAVYMLVQFIQTYILEPLVVGSQVRINPLFTIIGLVAGELIWGIAGMVLAIPLLGVLRIVFDHIPSLKPYAYLIGSEPQNQTSFLDKVKRWFHRKSKDSMDP